MPDAGWVRIYFSTFDAVAAAAGLAPLRFERLPEERTEVRVWIGGGIGYPQSLYRLSIDRGEVTGELIWHWPIRELFSEGGSRTSDDLMRHANAGSCTDFRRDEATGVCRAILEPEPAWAEVLRDAEQAGLRHLPDESTLPPDGSIALDGWSLTVELLEGRFYRTYHYGNPQHRAWPEARLAERIADIFRSLDERIPPAEVEGVYRGTMRLFGHRLIPCDGTEPWRLSSHLGTLAQKSLLVLPESESSTYVVTVRGDRMPEWLARERDYGTHRVLQPTELLSLHAASDEACSGP
jgi:hypothetical protein